MIRKRKYVIVNPYKHVYKGLQLFSFRFEDNKCKYRLSSRLTDH